MHQPDPQKPPTAPSLKYFMPYHQTIIGCVVIAMLVGLLIGCVQWFLGER
jgi:hypothetical protein